MVTLLLSDEGPEELEAPAKHTLSSYGDSLSTSRLSKFHNKSSAERRSLPSMNSGKSEPSVSDTEQLHGGTLLLLERKKC